MIRNTRIEMVVGVLIFAAVLGLFVLAFRVSGLSNVGGGDYYKINAEFSNIGGLKVRAPVSVAGVKVGEVTSITLDPKTFYAKVIMTIRDDVDNLPIDSSASILTQGLLGANYISLTPGLEDQALKRGGSIETTHSALILENLIGQLLLNVADGSKDKDDDDSDKK